MMLHRRDFTLAALSAARGLAAAQGTAKPLTLVVPFTPGSGPDGVVRALARELETLAATSVVVENRPGASSVLAAQQASKAPPDGSTVLVTGNVAFTGNPHVMKKLPYDPVADFRPVAPVAKGPMVLYANPKSVPVGDAQKMLELIKAAPGRFSFGYTSITSRLPAEVMRQRHGLSLVGIPYRSGTAALPDLIEGRIDLLFTDFSPWPYVAEGKLRAIAVTGSQRSASAPSLPTFAEAGVAEMDITFWLALYLPARTAQAHVDRWHGWVDKALKAPEVQAALGRAGMAGFMLPPAGLAAYQAQEAQAWGRIIKSANIQPE